MNDDMPESAETTAERPELDKHEVQRNWIAERLGVPIGRGPIGWRGTGVDYQYRVGQLLVRERYVDAVRRTIERLQVSLTGQEAARDGASETVLAGLSVLYFREDGVLNTLAMMELVRNGGVDPRFPDGGLRVTGLGAGAVSLNHIVSITGDAANCPDDEPRPVPPGTPPGPACNPASDAGAGVRVVVVDNGFDPDAPSRSSWLAGVTGDPDPGISGGTLTGYAGHGTMIAGLVRQVAPQAEVHVRAYFPAAAALSEADLVRALDTTLQEDDPDIISMSAGARSYDATGLLSFEVFHETLLRHHKGVVLVVAAGNDGVRTPFWPAAAPYTVSVGALSSTLDGRATFSNLGGWVDVYAPGEDVVNAFPVGDYTCWWPPYVGQVRHFDGMARWSGTSFSTPIVSGLIAARMSRTGENGTTAAAALIKEAQDHAIAGMGAVATLP